jgi:hypothetical protein
MINDGLERLSSIDLAFRAVGFFAVQASHSRCRSCTAYRPSPPANRMNNLHDECC